MKPSRARIERAFFLAAIALHMLTAWLSSGYYADDEHYQVITFAEVKAGHEPASALPWEHAARIRSVVLPSACLAVFTTADAIGIHDPFLKAFLLRLLTALAALIIVRRWTRAASSFVPEPLHAVFLALSWFLWFLPYQHVRFTGETWSGLLVLAALTELLGEPPTRRRAWRIGMLIGLAVLIRPPTLLMAAGLVAWAMNSGRIDRRAALGILSASFVMVGLGCGLDSWWYGGPTCSLWNYAMTGIEGRPDGSLDVHPWWFYGPLLVKDMLVPIGLLALLAFAVLWGKRPSGPLLWIITPFLIFHLFVAHKETRFLFPLADFLPLMVVLAFASLDASWRTGFKRNAIRLAIGLALIANILGLSVASLTPAGSGRTQLAKELGRSASKACYHADNDLVWKAAIPPFYGGPDRPLATTDECEAPCPIVIAQHGESSSCLSTPIAQAEPWWARELLNAYAWRPQDRAWAAYRAPGQGQ